MVKDHLHIRGEYKYLTRYFLGLSGSPPHTWRIPPSFHLIKAYWRITSTYVENTLVPPRKDSTDWDHLHIRGEYPRKACPIGRSSGSPPHTWRIQIDHEEGFKIKGITSTYVENTLTNFVSCIWIKDHLHIRGEYLHKCCTNIIK